MLPARRPYADELAFSAILRCCAQFNISTKKLGQLYLGREGWRPSFLAASPLVEVAQLFRLSPEALLWNHTMFPYASVTLRRENYRRALLNAFGRTAEARKLGAITQNVSTALSFLRYCRYCAEEEKERLLVSFWHRSHNLPGVWVCERHMCFLWESTIAVGSSGPLGKSMPHECSGRRLGRGIPSDAMLRVAQTSRQWLHRDWGSELPVRATEYRQLAIANDWLSSHRPVDLELFTKCLSATFPRRYLLNCGLPGGPAKWAVLMLQPSIDLEFVPVKHALLLAMLERPRPEDLPRVDHVSSGPSGTRASVIDTFYARAARRELGKLIAQRNTVTTEEYLRAVGCWGVYKHRKAELPKLRAAVREFRGSAATVKQLRPGKRLYRTCSGEPTSSIPA